MKIVRVTYTANPAFVAQNKINIQAVMAALQKLNNPDINYTCCLSPDGKSFTHLSFFHSDGDRDVLNALKEFQYFQEKLKENGFEIPPKSELLELVGASKELFA